MTWNEQIYTLRRRAGLTQAEAAAQANVHVSSLVRWEAGGSMPQAADLCRLLSALNAKPAQKRQVLMATLNNGPCEVRADDLARILTTLRAGDRAINAIIASLA